MPVSGPVGSVPGQPACEVLSPKDRLEEAARYFDVSSDALDRAVARMLRTIGSAVWMKEEAGGWYRQGRAHFDPLLEDALHLTDVVLAPTAEETP